jgi:methyltransferase-like protein/cyclopropane fatty-acyl-phospholipid synthase-like methyltransferase
MFMDTSDISRLQQSYEDVPYLSQAYTQSHPNRLATIARLFMLSPAPITRCRVLELGCGAGGNIIPMAWHFPDSQFVGIEMAQGHVQACRKAIEELGITNLHIRHQNILEATDGLGTFDYIICHGVFSWVPRSVQDRIFAIASAHLNPAGIAYISYNTYPGWHIKEMVRHMMLYHAGQFSEIDQQLNQARASVQFIADTVEKEGDRVYALALKKELDNLKRCEDWYIFHDYMEVVNLPVYFHQFCLRAEQSGLQFLAEAEFGMMFSDEFSHQTNLALEDISQDIIRKEQYMDFLRNRPFRQTLLCRKQIEIKRYLEADCLNDLLISSEATPEKDTIDLSPQVIEKFKIHESLTIETSSAVLKTALLILKKNWPRALRFDALLEESVPYINKTFGTDSDCQTYKKELGRELLQCYISGGIRLTCWQSDFKPEIAERPKVSALTQYQAKQAGCAVSPYHEKISLDPLQRHVVMLLTGKNDRQTLCGRLEQLVDAGLIPLVRHGLPISDPVQKRRAIEERIEKTLVLLLNSELLVQ